MNVEWPIKYKFTSLFLTLRKDVRVTERQTYSDLDWLADIGGLIDALYLIGTYSLSPIVNYALNNQL